MSSTRRPGLAVVAVLLFVSGWATNHFAAIIPVLRDREGLSATVLAGAFGIYALGLLPGLLGGGALSDRTGRRPLVLTGATVAAAGNLLMLCWHPVAGIYLGRLVVGVGVGLAMSAGTAWAADLGGRTGTTIAGTVLTAGFASGPLATGLVAEFASGSAQSGRALHPHHRALPRGGGARRGGRAAHQRRGRHGGRRAAGGRPARRGPGAGARGADGAVGVRLGDGADRGARRAGEHPRWPVAGRRRVRAGSRHRRGDPGGRAPVRLGTAGRDRRGTAGRHRLRARGGRRLHGRGRALRGDLRGARRGVRPVPARRPGRRRDADPARAPRCGDRGLLRVHLPGLRAARADRGAAHAGGHPDAVPRAECGGPRCRRPAHGPACAARHNDGHVERASRPAPPRRPGGAPRAEPAAGHQRADPRDGRDHHRRARGVARGRHRAHRRADRGG
ncbi:MFS transporter [Nocardioides convexus]|uniref:MFS transporter n=1 Tax=Nocardioides convexus TaxID=2712224 RepID=UPI0024184D7A|nr:MFS transporter [Nocardioides convexus]